MAQVRGLTPALYDNVDKMVYDGIGQGLKELKPIWREYFNVKTSDRAFERVVTMVGMGDAPEKPEGQAFTTDMIRQGYTKDFTHTEFGFGFEVTQTALEDDQYDQLQRAPKWLAFSCRVVEEKRAANVLNNGFTTEMTPDGVALFSASHVLGGGGTARNILGTNADLSETSLTQALIDIQTQTKLESGQLVTPMQSFDLVVPPDLEFLAARLVKSISRPQSADNDINALKALRQWNVIVNPYLTDTDAWFLLAANSKMHGLTSYTRVPITLLEPMTDSRTRNRIYAVRFRRSYGAWMWQNTFATPGA
jgi:hypothetical protein